MRLQLTVNFRKGSRGTAKARERDIEVSADKEGDFRPITQIIIYLYYVQTCIVIDLSGVHGRGAHPFDFTFHRETDKILQRI